LTVARRAKLVAQGAAIGLVVLLFSLLVWSLVHNEGGGAAAAVARGEEPPAPDFTLERLDRSGELSLSSLLGKVVVLNFWGSWCYACKEEAKTLEDGWQRWRDDEVVVVGLDFHDFRSDARRFFRRYGETFPMVYDGPGNLLSKYGLTGAPETFFVDRKGRIVAHVVGAIEEDELNANIRRALASR
jgi:cytochrome c biogenesis protein CcmG, thiol:disulfide interchange protein DsbE